MYLRTVRGEIWIPSFNKQFVGDTLFAPGDIVANHLTNQFSKFSGEFRSSTPTLPTPEQSKPRAVLPDQGPRCDIDDGVLLIKAAREEYEEIARRIVKPSRHHFAFLIERELLSKKEILPPQALHGFMQSAKKFRLFVISKRPKAANSIIQRTRCPRNSMPLAPARARKCAIRYYLRTTASLWGGEFWTDGYFGSTVGKHGKEDMIGKYVKNQGKEYQKLLEDRQLALF